MKNRLNLLILLLSIIVFSACKKTVEGEKNSFDRNVQTLNQMSAKYPNFAEVMQQELSRAKQIFESASSISDEKAKIDKMAEANNVFYNGVSGGLSRYENKVINLQNSIRNIGEKSIDANERQGLRVDLAINNAQNSINNSNTRLISSKPTDLSSALAIINQSLQEINMQYDNLQRIQSSLNNSKQAQNKNDSLNNQNQGGNSNVDNTPKVVMVKCKYCGQSFDKMAHKTCHGCGATAE